MGDISYKWYKASEDALPMRQKWNYFEDSPNKCVHRESIELNLAGDGWKQPFSPNFISFFLALEGYNSPNVAQQRISIEH